MNALNEVNKVISMISNVSSRHSSMDEDEWLTAEKNGCKYCNLVYEMKNRTVSTYNLKNIVIVYQRN